MFAAGEKSVVIDKKGRPICECIAKCPELDGGDGLDQVGGGRL